MAERKGLDDSKCIYNNPNHLRWGWKHCEACVDPNLVYDDHGRVVRFDKYDRVISVGGVRVDNPPVIDTDSDCWDEIPGERLEAEYCNWEGFMGTN